MPEKFKGDKMLLLQALNAVNTGIGVIDESLRFLYVNEKFSSIYGYDENELLEKNYMMLFGEQDRHATSERIEDFFQHGGQNSLDLRMKRHNGTLVDVHVVQRVISNEDGIRHLLLTVNDLTEMKNIQQQLTKSKKEFQSIIRSSAAKSEEIRRLIMNAALDAIICIDQEDRITLWNPQAEKIFGWKKEEVEGKQLSNIIIPEMYREMHRNGMKKYLKTGHGPALNVLLELTAINRENREFPIELTVLPIRQENEDEIFCAFIRDITERKKNENMLKDLNNQMSKNIEELAKSNVELEQFAFIASHDLQEPLRMVTNFLTQLDKKYNDKLDDIGKQYLHFAVDGAVRMRKIILDLLEYSRVGKVDSNTEHVDTMEIVSDILRFNKNLIEEQNFRFLVGKLPVIRANRTSMQQVFQNIIGNAIKYRAESQNPIIEIQCFENEDFWEFSVRDNGIGIESRFFEKIFVIFQRLHVKEQYSGTGIGLAICKKIIESHGGSIRVESEPGKGSTFYFTIRK